MTLPLGVVLIYLVPPPYAIHIACYHNELFAYIGIVLDIRKMLLLKSCFESTSDIVRLCWLIRNNDVVNLLCKYNARYSMASLFIKSYVKCIFFKSLQSKGLV